MNSYLLETGTLVKHIHLGILWFTFEYCNGGGGGIFILCCGNPGTQIDGTCVQYKANLSEPGVAP